MFIGRVRPDLVDDDAQAEFMRPGHQGVEIRQRAEDRVDIAIIRHVIAEVAHRAPEKGRKPDRVHRSEEHTSELQSLMRISYAVFCLKKKIQTQTTKLSQNKTKTQKRT